MKIIENDNDLKILQLVKLLNYFKFYNEERPHRSIEMLTPSQAYEMTGELKGNGKI